MPATTIDKSGALGAEIVVYGLEAVRNGLEAVDPKLRRNLDRELKTAVGTVAGAAARKVRSRTGATAAGYKVQMRSGRYKVVNKTRGGAILEFAAVPHCPQGATLVGTLNEEYGKPGRLLWDAWDTMEPYVTDTVRRIVDEASDELERVSA
mgnify:CR=1 FL=1